MSTWGNKPVKGATSIGECCDVMTQNSNLNVLCFRKSKFLSCSCQVKDKTNVLCSKQYPMWISVWTDLLRKCACMIVLTQRQWPFLLQKVLSALRSVLSADIFTGCSHALHSGLISIYIWHPDLHCFPFTLQLHYHPPLSSTSLLTNSDSHPLLNSTEFSHTDRLKTVSWCASINNTTNTA